MTARQAQGDIEVCVLYVRGGQILAFAAAVEAVAAAANVVVVAYGVCDVMPSAYQQLAV